MKKAEKARRKQLLDKYILENQIAPMMPKKELCYKERVEQGHRILYNNEHVLVGDNANIVINNVANTDYVYINDVDMTNYGKPF